MGQPGDDNWERTTIKSLLLRVTSAAGPLPLLSQMVVPVVQLPPLLLQLLRPLHPAAV